MSFKPVGATPDVKTLLAGHVQAKLDEFAESGTLRLRGAAALVADYQQSAPRFDRAPATPEMLTGASLGERAKVVIDYGLFGFEVGIESKGPFGSSRPLALDPSIPATDESKQEFRERHQLKPSPSHDEILEYVTGLAERKADLYHQVLEDESMVAVAHYCAMNRRSTPMVYVDGSGVGLAPDHRVSFAELRETYGDRWESVAAELGSYLGSSKHRSALENVLPIGDEKQGDSLRGKLLSNLLELLYRRQVEVHGFRAAVSDEPPKPHGGRFAVDLDVGDGVHLDLEPLMVVPMLTDRILAETKRFLPSSGELMALSDRLEGFPASGAHDSTSAEGHRRSFAQMAATEAMAQGLHEFAAKAPAGKSDLERLADL